MGDESKLGCLSVQCFSVDDVESFPVGGEDVQMLWCRDSGKCNVQLSMAEAVLLQMYSSVSQGLSLGFVDCHGEARFHRKLKSLEWDGCVAGY